MNYPRKSLNCARSSKTAAFLLTVNSVIVKSNSVASEMVRVTTVYDASIKGPLLTFPECP
jgi:hypothetical protein